MTQYSRNLTINDSKTHNNPYNNTSSPEKDEERNISDLNIST